MSRNAVTFLVALLLAADADLFADGEEKPASPGPAALAPGTRVRVGLGVGGERLVGTLIEADGETVTLLTDSNQGVNLRRSAVTRLEVSQGRRTQVRKGILIGLAAGAVLGATMAVQPENCGGDSPYFCSRAEAVGGGLVLGALLGAGGGVLWKTDRWVEVPADRIAFAAGPPSPVAEETGVELPAHQDAPQGSPLLAPGARIRVWTSLRERVGRFGFSSSPLVLEGDLVDATDEMLTLNVKDGVKHTGVHTVPRAAITRLEVRREGRRNRAKTALLGAGLGAGVGVFGVVLIAQGVCQGPAPPQVPWICTDDGIKRWVPGVVVAGTVVGAVVGAISGRTDRWEEVPRNRLRLGIAPAPGRGVALAVSLSF